MPFLGEQVYRRFYTKEKEQLNGVLAICVGRPASQPCSVLSDIISVSILSLTVFLLLSVLSATF